MGTRILENASNEMGVVIGQFSESQRWSFFAILNFVGGQIASVNSTPESDDTFLQDVFLLQFCVITSAAKKPAKVTWYNRDIKHLLLWDSAPTCTCASKQRYTNPKKRQCLFIKWKHILSQEWYHERSLSQIIQSVVDASFLTLGSTQSYFYRFANTLYTLFIRPRTPTFTTYGVFYLCLCCLWYL